MPYHIANGAQSNDNVPHTGDQATRQIDAEGTFVNGKYAHFWWVEQGGTSSVTDNFNWASAASLPLLGGASLPLFGGASLSFFDLRWYQRSGKEMVLYPSLPRGCWGLLNTLASTTPKCNGHCMYDWVGRRCGN